MLVTLGEKHAEQTLIKQYSIYLFMKPFHYSVHNYLNGIKYVYNKI